MTKKRKPSKTSAVQSIISGLKRGGSGRKDGKEAFDKVLKRAVKPKDSK